MDLMEMVKAIQDRSNLNMPSLTQYSCPSCHDTGWIETAERTVRRCACVDAKMAEDRIRNSGLAESLDRMTFDSFVTRTETQARIKRTATEYLEALLASRDNPRRPWLFIGGNPGSGTTHICTAVCGELLKRRVPVRYMQWVDVARTLKGSVNDDDFTDLVSDYINVKVLYIDDLLKQRYTMNPAFTEADIKIAFTILNARYIQNKATIISTEWDLVNQLLPADEGVFSRVYERSKGFRVAVERKAENNFRLTA